MSLMQSTWTMGIDLPLTGCEDRVPADRDVIFYRTCLNEAAAANEERPYRGAQRGGVARTMSSGPAPVINVPGQD